MAGDTTIANECESENYVAENWAVRLPGRTMPTTLIGTAKLNDVDPQAWLADVLGRIAETPQSRLDELLPWNWVPEQRLDQAA